MKKSGLKKSTKIVSIVCAIAILLSVYCQFMAGWSFTGVIENEDTGEKRAEEVETSLASYIWFPFTNESKAFETYLKDPTINFEDTIAVEEIDEDVLSDKVLDIYYTELTYEKLDQLESAKKDLLKAEEDLKKAKAEKAEEGTAEKIKAAEEKVETVKAKIEQLAKEAEEAAKMVGLEVEIDTVAKEKTEAEEEKAEEAPAIGALEDDFNTVLETITSETALAVTDGNLAGQDANKKNTYYVSMVEITEYHKDITDKSHYNTVLANAKNNENMIKTYEEFSTKIKKEYATYINNLVVLPILLLIASLLSIFFIFRLARKGAGNFFAPIAAFVIGLLNLIYLLTQPIFLLSQVDAYNKMRVIFIATIVVGIVFLAKSIKEVVEAKKAE